MGRYSKDELTDPKTGEVIVGQDEFIDEATADKIIAAGYKGMNIRNSFTCECTDGICRTVFGGVNNQGHECREHTCEQAWHFMKQFTRPE